ncbi:MAG TPA: methylmalonyl-CoA mutase family protein [Miltoncostaeaceae bacterium]|nr:methylmalonyl-CoA mutase family protein [Miltoncostaeaceae bacterium]
MAVARDAEARPSRSAGPDRTTTMSGHPLAPVYEGPVPPMEAPGEYPYTRGIHPQMFRSRLWTMRMFAGFGSPEDTNARFRHLLSQGQTGLSTAFDMPSLMGYDPDHPLSEGEVGREGVSVAHAGDMARLFDGIDLGAVSTSMTISGPAPVALALFVAAAERSGVPRAALRGTLQTDILKEFIAQKEWIVPERPSMRLVGDLIAFCAEEMPLWHPVSVSGSHIRAAGATAAQELAFTIVDGLAYVEDLVARGVDPDSFLPRFSFFFNFHIDFFEEVAKIRAARRLWAQLMRERVGAKNPKSWQLRTHVQTSGVSLSAQQPLLNLARTAVEALGAVMAGAQSLHTNAWDETLSIPTEESATLALRTQQMIAGETGAASVADPLGGSWLVEKLTDELEQEARDYIRRIDELGGMVAAVEAGFPQAEIAEAAYRYQRAFEDGERVMVGVNAHVEDDEDEPPIHTADPEAERLQVERVRAWRAQRDAGAHERALAAVAAACEGTDNVMPHLVAAADAGATIGEMCDVFRSVWGRYRDPARW